MRVLVFFSFILYVVGIISAIVIRTEHSYKPILKKNTLLENSLDGSWLVASHTYAPNKNCHQYNFTNIDNNFMMEEIWQKDGEIMQEFWDIIPTGNKTFQVFSTGYSAPHPNITLEVIFQTWDRDITIIYNHSNKHIMVLSPRPFFDEWEYLMIEVACRLQNKNCDNLFSSFDYKKC